MFSNKNKEELEKNRKKLNKLIEDNALLEEIQKQSEVLDKYITTKISNRRV